MDRNRRNHFRCTLHSTGPVAQGHDGVQMDTAARALDCEVGETVYSWELIKIEKSVVAKVLLRSWMIMQYFGMVIPPLIGTYHGQHNVFQ